jgi:TPR repeat protein
MLLRGHADRVWSAQFSPDGQSVVTASDDKTARIWDARAPALDAQIDSAVAAQFDPLTDAEKFNLGLPAANDVRQWPAGRSKCDETAAAPYDPDRLAPGAMLDQVVTDIALMVCADSKGTSGSSRPANNRARSTYQHGRALMASGNLPGARRNFEEALADGYRAASVDLALLLSQPSAGMTDVSRALSLYEQGWHDGVTVAAFELGNLYEQGVSRIGSTDEYLLAPDKLRAWSWFQKGAHVGEPKALAHLAEKADEVAFFESDPGKRKAHLLESFKYYAAAAERARTEDWPDDAWRNWRYRRASLARLLAREGMMQEVADAYKDIRRLYSPATHSLGQRMVSLFGMD